MAKFRHETSRSGSSAGIGKPFIHPERLPSKPNRSVTSKRKSEYGTFVCPACGASVNIKRAGVYDIEMKPSIKYQSLIVSKHRVGGGQYSMTKGDYLCKGFGHPISKS